MVRFLSTGGIGRIRLRCSVQTKRSGDGAVTWPTSRTKCLKTRFRKPESARPSGRVIPWNASYPCTPMYPIPHSTGHLEEIIVPNLLENSRPLGVGVRNPVKKRLFPVPKSPYRLWGPPSLPFKGYRIFFPGVTRPGDVGLTTYVRLLTRFQRVQLYFYARYMPLWRGQAVANNRNGRS
jgi:hypothetical protein